MRILQIANGYCGNRLYKELFARLRSLNIDLDVFVPLLIGSNNSKDEPKDVRLIPCFKQLDRILFYRKQRKMFDAIQEQWDVAKCQIIHAHTVFSGGYVAWKLHQRYRIPYIVAVRNTDKNVFFRYMVHLRHIGVKIMRDAAAVVFLSPAYRDSVIEAYIPKAMREEIFSKSVVIPNGISDLFQKNKCCTHLLSEKGVRLIYVGEITGNKNVSTAIKAIKYLRDEGISATLTIAGPIREKKYKGYFEQYPFVTYLGPLSPEKVKDAMRQADIFVMPSHMETFGLVYAEAMSQGLPVLYTRGQGFDGQFPDGEVGYAVDDHDPHDVAEKIKTVMSCYDEIAQRAYEDSTKFSWDKIATVYSDLYSRIIETHNTSKGEK